MKFLLPLWLLTLLFLPHSAFAKCVGGICKTCTNCSRCTYCKGPGSCSVCNASLGRSIPRSSAVSPGVRNGVIDHGQSGVLKALKRKIEVGPWDKVVIIPNASATRYYSTENASEPSWVRQQRLERSMGVRVAQQTFRSAVATTPRASVPRTAFTAKCVAVADGNTLQVSYQGKVVTIRLIAIDAPEIQQAYGPQAKNSLSQLVLGQNLKIYPTGRDASGRTVAWVFCGSLAINSAQVEKGYAWWDRQDMRQEAKIGALENTARATKIGLWNDDAPTAPWEWRKKAGLGR